MSPELHPKAAPDDSVNVPRFNSDRAMAGWMQELAPYGIVSTDRELRVRSWNHWMATHSGLTLEQVSGRLLFDLFPTLQTRRLDERFHRALAGEVSVLSAALHRYLIPMPVPVEGTGLPHMLQTARIAPLPGEQGYAGVVLVIEDVTQREVQSAIVNRQQELERLMSSALATLLQSTDPAADMSDIFAAIKPALRLDVFLCYLVGPDGALALNNATGLSPRQREFFASLPDPRESYPTGSAGEYPERIESGPHHQAVTQLGLKSHCTFALGVNGRRIGLLTFGSYAQPAIPAGDVAVLARLARYLAIAEDRTAREREIRAASQAKDDFLAALSHELRTPLNPVLLLASDAADNPAYSSEVRESFRVIEKNALLEARLIDDLLDLTRIEHGKMGLELRNVDAHGVLRDALVTLRGEAAEKQQQISVILEAQETTVSADSARLQQIFWNVLKNAVKFTPVGGQIIVRSRLGASGRQIEFEISDNGIGMEPAEMTRIFGAFAQGDHAEQGRAHRFGGLGLGLAITRKLVELHRGRIEATSPGRNHGSVFLIVLPLVETDRMIARQLPTATTAPVTAATRVPRRLLLVEDHQATRELLGRLLRARGYEVVSAGCVAEAQQRATEGTYDLVLSDIGLPDGDGFDLMQKLRQNHRLKGIALTGYGMQEDIARSNDSGFVAHLTKPISVAMLDQTLSFALTPK